eukprot:CAMPEP_0115529552 /NCGR_PEP_ID=MMETSP0271-20121206/84007_1 /TAXON_ID=71861 /ORGANISM="Scrippsiella trochoidea, Strain CCMP3099" /LENGTH=40 /DNA_ID= /DNA_START= /DNA_END= /DNA_ORIENTATION=
MKVHATKSLTMLPEIPSLCRVATRSAAAAKAKMKYMEAPM